MPATRTLLAYDAGARGSENAKMTCEVRPLGDHLQLMKDYTISTGDDVFDIVMTWKDEDFI